MAISNLPNNRKNTIAQQLLLCFTGAVAGLFYAYLFFGEMAEMLILSTFAGTFIVFLYTLLEFNIFSGNSRSSSLATTYFLRIAAYFIFFFLSLGILSFLHAQFSFLLYEDPVLIVLEDDYLPFLPFYLFYALLAAFVFQSIWLFNAVKKSKNTEQFSISANGKKLDCEVILVGLKPAVGNSLPEEDIIYMLNLLFLEFKKIENRAESYYENSQLRICVPFENAIADNYTERETQIKNIFNLHIDTSGKMLQLQFGYYSGEVEILNIGSQKIISGEALKSAEANFKIVSAGKNLESGGLPVFEFSK